MISIFDLKAQDLILQLLTKLSMLDLGRALFPLNLDGQICQMGRQAGSCETPISTTAATLLGLIIILQ
jgi:hypothetical protein